MQRWILLFGLLIGFSAHAETIEHSFKDGETLWFLSQVYYGNGESYARILEANGLKSADRVRDGQKLRIPSPLFKPSQPGFDLRVTHLKGRRAEALAKRLVASETPPPSKTPGKKVASARSEPPVAKIEAKTPTPEEAPAPKKKAAEKEELTPFEKAKRELGGK